MTHRRLRSLVLAGSAAFALACSGGEDVTGPTRSSTSVPSLSVNGGPANLDVFAGSSTQINMTWVDNATNETQYEVWRSTTGINGTYKAIAWLAANRTSYSDKNLTPNTQYCYKVKATNTVGGGASPFAGPDCATTLDDGTQPPPPNPPSALQANTISSSQINLGWQDNSTNEAGFEVWRSTTGTNGTYSLLTTLGANVEAFNNTGLSAGTQYCYKVRATGSGGAPASSFTTPACATTSSGGGGGSTAPSNVNATAVSQSQINITWTNNVTNGSQIEVWRSTNGTNYSAIAWLSASRTSYSNIGLTASTTYCYKIKTQLTGGGATGFGGPSCATTQAADPNAVRITTYGDSNTDTCNGDGSPEIASYVSRVPRLGPNDPNLSCQVAGKVEAKWAAVRTNAITAINHAITGSSTGGGGFGGPDRTGLGAPNSRLKVNNVTRFEAEILGRGFPWNGGEPTNSFYPSGPVTRVRAYTPGTNDFAYVSIGTNDPLVGMSTSQTITNLTWMIDNWTGAGHAANHFIITTLPPRTDDNYGNYIPTVNTAIRSLASSKGVKLIDLCNHLSDDNCLTWSSASLNIGDGVHYTQTVRGWIADQIVAIMQPLVPGN